MRQSTRQISTITTPTAENQAETRQALCKVTHIIDTLQHMNRRGHGRTAAFMMQLETAIEELRSIRDSVA